MGTYPIIPAFNDPNNLLRNYAVTAREHSRSHQAPLSVAAGDASRFYGDPEPGVYRHITGSEEQRPDHCHVASIADSSQRCRDVCDHSCWSDPNGQLSNYTCHFHERDAYGDSGAADIAGRRRQPRCR